MSKYGHKSINWFEAIVNKLGGEAQAEKFLRGEIAVSESARKWREQDGVIYFSVISDGTTGNEWIARLKKKGFRISARAKSVLRSPDFKPTSGVTTEVAVLRGMLFNTNHRVTKKIRVEADKRKLEKSNAEVACLIREKFMDEEIEVMGLCRIAVMHELIKDSDGDPFSLCVCLQDVGFHNGRRLDAYHDSPDVWHSRDEGLVFAVSQVSSQR